MRFRISTAILFLGLFMLEFFLPGGLYAESLSGNADKRTDSRFAEYLYSASQIQTLYQVGMSWDKILELYQDCSAGHNIKPSTVMQLKPINFSSDYDHPIDGVWLYRFIFERCGKGKMYNAIFIANKGEQPKAVPFYPGNTNASPQLISDAMMSASIAAAIRGGGKQDDTGCHDYTLIDTKLTVKPHDVTKNGNELKGVWNEVWTMKGCGKTVDVAGVFVPDGKGGTSFNFK